MWINAGRSQFHLPDGKAQVLRGHTGLVIEGREALLARLAAVAKKLEGTAFTFAEHNDQVEATCPWGNRMRVHEPDAARFGRITLGIPGSATSSTSTTASTCSRSSTRCAARRIRCSCGRWSIAIPRSITATTRSDMIRRPGRWGRINTRDRALAGAGGIEPPNGGIKIRCLTAWLRPIRRRRERRKNWHPKNLHPQIPSGRSRSIGSGAAFQPPGGAKYHRPGDPPGRTLSYPRSRLVPAH